MDTLRQKILVESRPVQLTFAEITLLLGGIKIVTDKYAKLALEILLKPADANVGAIAEACATGLETCLVAEHKLRAIADKAMPAITAELTETEIAYITELLARDRQ